MLLFFVLCLLLVLGVCVGVLGVWGGFVFRFSLFFCFVVLFVCLFVFGVLFVLLLLLMLIALLGSSSNTRLRIQ